MVAADGRRVINGDRVSGDQAKRLEESLLLAQETCPQRNRSLNYQPVVPDVLAGESLHFDWRPEMKGIILSAFFAGLVNMLLCCHSPLIDVQSFRSDLL